MVIFFFKYRVLTYFVLDFAPILFLFFDREKGIDVCFVFRNFNQKGVKALFSRNKNTIMGLFCRKWEEEKVISDKHTKEALTNVVSYLRTTGSKELMSEIGGRGPIHACRSQTMD